MKKIFIFADTIFFLKRKTYLLQGTVSETYDFERHEEAIFEDSANCLVDIEAQQKKVKK